jgi:signal transduction histidine kinase
MSDNSESQRYVEVTTRLSTMTVIGANLITVLVLIATWGNWRGFAVIAGVQMAVIPFNLWINFRVLTRWRVARAELLRTTVNLTAVAVSSFFAGWPFPVWFWMVYVALAFDQFGPRIFWATLLSFIVVEVAAGFVYGAPWIYPLCFASFALFCSRISAARVDIIRDMLTRSDIQRIQIERAHAATREAHAQLVQETRMREQMEIELRQAQKLEAVGRLASGVAHEINTPVQFVSDSVQFLREASADLLRLIEVYQRNHRALLDGGPAAEAARAVAEAEEEVDLAYLIENLPKAIERSRDGTERIATIVRSMKAFAHPDQVEKTPVDINQAIANTLVISRGEYKHVATVEVELEPVPLVPCHAGEINQVILNLVVNAAHAIEDARAGSGATGQITVRTHQDGGSVVISVQDDGPGIRPEIRERIFEPFFTTKPMGRGTGQGLAIARSVVQKHGGELTFTSEVGAGTTFTVRLPIRDPAGAQIEAA